MEAIEILYLSLAVCAGVLTVFISVTLLYMMFILRDVTKILDRAREVMDKVDRTITKPLLMTKAVIDFLSPFIQQAEDRVKSKKKKS